MLIGLVVIFAPTNTAKDTAKAGCSSFVLLPEPLWAAALSHPEMLDLSP